MLQNCMKAADISPKEKILKNVNGFYGLQQIFDKLLYVLQEWQTVWHAICQKFKMYGTDV